MLTSQVEYFQNIFEEGIILRGDFGLFVYRLEDAVYCLGGYNAEKQNRHQGVVHVKYHFLRLNKVGFDVVADGAQFQHTLQRKT